MIEPRKVKHLKNKNISEDSTIKLSSYVELLLNVSMYIKKRETIGILNNGP